MIRYGGSNNVCARAVQIGTIVNDDITNQVEGGSCNPNWPIG